jgi:acyl-CoA synthetase (AMP-forming)/AMP-acid ligase II
MTLVSDWLAFHADRTPDKLAMVDQGTGREFTYYQFNDRSTRLASYLRDKRGESGKAIVVLAAGAALTQEQIIEHCAKNLAKYKVSKAVVFVDELLCNATGKVLKRILRE